MILWLSWQNILGVSMYNFYGNYYVYLCVYRVMSDYLCVYIVMRDYLNLFLINVIIYFYCMLKARKKTHNLRYIP